METPSVTTQWWKAVPRPLSGVMSIKNRRLSQMQKRQKQGAFRASGMHPTHGYVIFQ
jgi:prephenate dehydrogenase